MLSYVITPQNLTVVVDGKSHTINRDHATYTRIRTALLDEDEKAVRESLTVVEGLAAWAKGPFTMKDNELYYKDEVVPKPVRDRMKKMLAKGESPEPLMRFWERLDRNPSYRSRNQLFDFMQNTDIAIEESGTLLAYKSVKSDLYDVYSGTIKNDIGTVVSYPRNRVSDDPETPCHEGLHVGALSYAEWYLGESKTPRGRIIVCRIDPEDVVCVPKDSSFRKMRVCRYQVVGFHNGSILPPVVESQDVAEPEPAVEVTQQPAEAVDPTYADAKVGHATIATPKEPPKRVPHNHDHATVEQLKGLSLDELRRYATHNLRLVGASKIPGGKDGLIRAILANR